MLLGEELEGSKVEESLEEAPVKNFTNNPIGALDVVESHFSERELALTKNGDVELPAHEPQVAAKCFKSVLLAKERLPGLEFGLVLGEVRERDADVGKSCSVTDLFRLLLLVLLIIIVIIDWIFLHFRE